MSTKIAWPDGWQTFRRGLLPVALVATWAIGTTYGWIDPKTWGSPSKVSTAWGQLTGDGFLWKAILGSVSRDLGGFFAGAIAGFLLGASLGLSRLLERVALPTFEFLKQISVFAWLPLLGMFFGLGEASKIAFIGISAFFPLFGATFAGFRSVHRNQQELGAIYKLGPWKRLTKIVLPAALPSILAGVPVALVFSWTATVGAEFFLAAGYSIGGFLIQGAQQFNMSLVIIGVTILGVIGWGLNSLAVHGGAYLLRNRPKTLQA
jgi:sulfonate transport system permease protein